MVNAIFDRRLLRARKARAARIGFGDNFLTEEIGKRLAERLSEIKRDFPVAVELGGHGHVLSSAALEGAQIDRLVRTGLGCVSGADDRAPEIICDEEFLPFRANSLDAMLSVFGLHWVNDLPGCLVQIRNALAENGLFLAAIAGGSTLRELRWALTQAELQIVGGAGPRVIPFVDVREAAALLQRAGFGMPMADIEAIDVRYREPFKLLADLRAMGETNAMNERSPRTLRRDVLALAMELYRSEFADADGLVPATFEIVFLTGWKDTR